MPRRRKNAITDDEIAQLRSTIMQHTSHVIARGGIAGCTLSAVARSASCSVGMIQHHFDTRDALVLASIEYRSDLAIEEWTRLARAHDDPLATLRALLAFAVEGDATFADAWGFWVQAYSAALREEDVREPIIRALTVWRSLFVDTVARACASFAQPRALTHEQIAAFLVAAIDGYALQTLGGFYGGTPASMQTALCRLAEALLEVPAGALAASGQPVHAGGPAPATDTGSHEGA